MNAKPLPLDATKSVKDKISNSKNNSENVVIGMSLTEESYDRNADEKTIYETEDFILTGDGNSSPKLKKSSFQITRIVKTSETGDSADDLDDITNSEDVGSSVLETSKLATFECDAHSLDILHSSSSVEDVESLTSCHKHLHINTSHSIRPRPNDINSRFKIVQIESNKPLKRGRWTCLEFLDPPHLGSSLEKLAKPSDTCSENSCLASPIYYVQVEKEDPSENSFAAAIIYSNGQPSLEPNPVPLYEGVMSLGSCSNQELMVLSLLKEHGSKPIKPTSCLSSSVFADHVVESGSRDHNLIPSSFIAHQQLHPSSSSSCLFSNIGAKAVANGIIFDNDGLAHITNEEDRVVFRTGSDPSFTSYKVSEAVSSTPLFAIVASSANSCSSGFADSDISGGICALDNKIEQAMDLVKSHLMFAVHEEVELLKEQIKELTIKKGQLEYENTVLRASATQETLEKLHGSLSATGLS